MRTNWGALANQDTPELLPDYEPSVGAVGNALKSYWGKEISDPAQVAQVVLCLASSMFSAPYLLSCQPYGTLRRLCSVIAARAYERGVARRPPRDPAQTSSPRRTCHRASPLP